ncbi:MAG: peptidylprolyl isomerase [Clostridia bacterium]|nr:peptidylprolyl isomerase [Clostridia bacterium]
MKSKIFKKIALCFASALIACSVGAFAGCAETDHPEVRITYEFNGSTYSVEYKLYRNMYPHTVRHFIELSEEGFYDNTVIHNYQPNDWFTGGYTYNEAEYSANVGNEGQMKEYLEQFSKEDAYSQLFAAGKLSASVYEKVDANGKVIADSKYPTVMGEFYNNINQVIEKGALTADYGCLKMFYYEYDKDTVELARKVYVTPTDDQTILADYKKNCATSLFALQTGVSSTYTEKNYTVFAQLKNTEPFDNLVAAVKDYISDNHSGKADDFYTSLKDVNVGNNMKEVTLNAPKTPIIIQSVKVTKY